MEMAYFLNVLLAHLFTSDTGLSSSSLWQRILLRPSCRLWRGWLPLLPKSVAAECLAVNQGGFPMQLGSAKYPSWDPADVDHMTKLVPAAAKIWTDASRDSIDHLDVEIAGSGAFSTHHLGCFRRLVGSAARMSMAVMEVVVVASPLFQVPPQPVQRTEFWGVIIAGKVSLGFVWV